MVSGPRSPGGGYSMSRIFWGSLLSGVSLYIPRKCIPKSKDFSGPEPSRVRLSTVAQVSREFFFIDKFRAKVLSG